MKIVYNAANSLEAHMIRGVLEQQDIPAYVQGEHLQSGVGEIPTIGLVKVNVDDENYQSAKKIIQNWEKAEIDTSTATTNSTATDKVNAHPSLLVLFFGFLCGAVAMHLYLNSSPVSHNGIDYNLDGKNDETWTYQNNVLIKTEIDNNLDGNIDNTSTFQKGLIDTQKLDDNFDGNFDTENFYEKGSVYYSKSDTNNDGKIDVTTEYDVNGPKRKVTIFNPKNNLPKKIQFYETNQLKSAEFDSDDDGDMDTIITYDFFEEEISSKPK